MERLMVCGCEWVGEFPASPWMDENESLLVCGCEWVGEFPASPWMSEAGRQ